MLTIRFKNGTSIIWPGKNQKIRYDIGWVIVIDRSGKEWAFPVVSVDEIIAKLGYN